MSIFALNGFFNAMGGADKLGSRLSDAATEMRIGHAIGNARRAATAEADQINGQMLDVPTGEVKLSRPGDVMEPATARRFRQEEGPNAAVETPVTQQKRREAVHGKVNSESLYLGRYLPEQVKALRESGDTAFADALEGYVSGEVGKRHASLFEQMVKAHSAGNFDVAAKAMEGLQELSSEGQQVKVASNGNGGYQVRLLDPKSGKEQAFELNEDRAIADLSSFMDPKAYVKRYIDSQQAQAKATAELAKERMQQQGKLAENGLKFRNDVALRKMDIQSRMNELITRHNLDMSKPTDAEKVYHFLEKQGVPGSELQAYLRSKAGGSDGGYGKALHPETAANRIWDSFNANPDTVVGRKGDRDVLWSELSSAEKEQLVMDELKGRQRAAAGVMGAGKPAASASPAGQAQNGLMFYSR